MLYAAVLRTLRVDLMDKAPRFCSIIIPTVGRDKLERAVNSALEQHFDPADFEVIVVNDSGRPLPDAGWQRSGRVQVLATARRERSVARNTAAAIACGRYLCFLDDDDWLQPNALRTFQQLAQAHPEAGWLYGSARFYDRQGRPLLDFRPRFDGNVAMPMLAGEWIPLQMSAIRGDVFFQVDGFPPTLTAGQDKYLQRRISLVADFCGSTELVAHVERGEEGTTTDYGRVAQLSRQWRETVLDQPSAYLRLRSSASSPYWAGKLARAYLTSGAWNLAHRQPGKALDRLAYGLVALLAAGRHLLQPALWRALGSSHAGVTYATGWSERE